MTIISRMTLEELFLELGELGVSTDFRCTHCHADAQLQIEELGPLVYKLRCGRCRSSAWGGARSSLWWKVEGFDGSNEIYSAETELGTDTLKSHLQDLAKQHLKGADRNRPSLWEVTLNRGAPRLSYMCGVNPHYAAIVIDPEV